MKFAKACVFICAAIVALSIARADPAAPSIGTPKADATTPDVATLLFENPQWAKAPQGSTIAYTYSKKTSIAAFGPSFDDKIILSLEKGDDAESRTAEVKMFSGVNAKPAGPFESAKQNPVLLLVLEENVQELAKVFKANPRYLKNAIRAAWRDAAKIENVPISVDGNSIPGTRISIQPFLNDAEKDKMMGLDSMVYIVEIAENVPGQIANIDVHGPANSTPTFAETLHYTSEKVP